MLKPIPVPQVEPAALLGEWHPLVEQLGATEGLVGLGAAAASLSARRVNDLPALRDFLRDYQTALLFPLELPAIQAAHTLAALGHTRELVALDQRLAREPRLRDFAAASRRVGQAQLKRLRPLRDHRLVRRYLAAVETGEAHGWHTLVYGASLAVYSLPLRQGLISYARQALRGFIQTAAPGLRLTEAAGISLLEELCANLPAAMEKILATAASDCSAAGAGPAGLEQAVGHGAENAERP